MRGPSRGGQGGGGREGPLPRASLSQEGLPTGILETVARRGTLQPAALLKSDGIGGRGGGGGATAARAGDVCW